MAVDLQLPPTAAHSAETPKIVTGEVRCALTGRVLKPEEAYWAPPLITAQALVQTIGRALFTAPGTLGQVLMADMPNVPYAPEARELLARRRSIEQIKLLGLLLVIAALLIVPIILLVS
jgi:hypothetical protein